MEMCFVYLTKSLYHFILNFSTNANQIFHVYLLYMKRPILSSSPGPPRASVFDFMIIGLSLYDRQIKIDWQTSYQLLSYKDYDLNHLFLILRPNRHRL